MFGHTITTILKLEIYFNFFVDNFLFARGKCNCICIEYEKTFTNLQQRDDNEKVEGSCAGSEL